MELFINYYGELVPCELIEVIGTKTIVKTKKVINKDVGFVITDSEIREIINLPNHQTNEY